MILEVFSNLNDSVIPGFYDCDRTLIFFFSLILENWGFVAEVHWEWKKIKQYW